MYLILLLTVLILQDIVRWAAYCLYAAQYWAVLVFIFYFGMSLKRLLATIINLCRHYKNQYIFSRPLARGDPEPAVCLLYAPPKIE